MPNSNAPSGPGKPVREARARIEERENLDEAMGHAESYTVPHRARSAPNRTPPPMNQTGNGPGSDTAGTKRGDDRGN
jgi:hypothetical protein